MKDVPPFAHRTACCSVRQRTRVISIVCQKRTLWMNYHPMIGHRDDRSSTEQIYEVPDGEHRLQQKPRMNKPAPRAPTGPLLAAHPTPGDTQHPTWMQIY